MSQLLPYLMQVPVLAALSLETLTRLDKNAEQRSYRRKQVIHFPDQPGDFVYVLCYGRVKISRVSDQGREVTLNILEGSQLFGESGMIDSNIPYELMAETLDDCLIAVFRRSDLLMSVLSTPSSAGEMLKLVTRRRTQAESQVADLVFLEVPKRLAKLLISLNDAPVGKTARHGLLAKAKFTHQELANMIGSTRETTTLILNDFKKQGLLEFVGRKIVLRNRLGLEALLRRNGQALSK